MVETFTYKAFGLIMRSEFRIPELLTFKGIPDIEIQLGKTPARLKKNVQKGVKFQLTKNEFLLEVDNIAKYYVNKGKKIIIETKKKEVDKEIRLFLLGSVFGALFLQKGLLPIHGSSIKFGNSATIFTGLSGVGKSSIATFFISQGYHVLADDISVVNQNLEVVPGYPNMRIWNDVLQELNMNNEPLIQLRPNIKKYQVPVNDKYCSTPLPLRNIIIINTKNSPGFVIEELTGINKFNALKNNTYRYRFVKGLEKQLDHFFILNKLLPEINMYKVTRPQSPLLLNELAEFIKDALKLDV